MRYSVNKLLSASAFLVKFQHLMIESVEFHTSELARSKNEIKSEIGF